MKHLVVFILLTIVAWCAAYRMPMWMGGGGFGKPKTPSFAYTGSITPGKVGPKLDVPSSIGRPDYAKDGVPKLGSDKGPLWDVKPVADEDIPRMRVAGRIAREVLDTAIRMVEPGVTTAEIDKVVHEATITRNAYPSPLNYHGYPKSCCTSINEIICHGIPDTTKLQAGMIMNIDVTIYHDGVHGDCSETVFVGGVEACDPKVRDLVVTTYEAWQAAIDACKPGVKYNELGGIIEDIIKPKGYSSVREFCGHGIGRVFHAAPNVLHYRNAQKLGTMAPGHCFTIEPMICMGSAKPVNWPDKWTAATADGKHTAQFEHTLLITEDGVNALTGKIEGSPKYGWER